MSLERPRQSEYDPYYEHYVALVPESDLLSVLRSQPGEARLLLQELDESRGAYAYAEGKWTLKELLGHIIDGERIFAYRVLRISRGDETPIEGFEQDGYIENAYSNDRTIEDLVSEFSLVRESNMKMFDSFREETWTRVGTANEKQISVRALAWIMAGHVRHHVGILKERYLV